MTNELKNINFNDLFILNTDPETYDFNAYLARQKHPIFGFCTRCEEKSCHVCPSDPKFRLQTITHGTSSSDLLQATNQQHLDLSDWHNEGVVFLMESPNETLDFLQEHEFKGVKKKPSTEWYWLHEQQTKQTYPQEFDRDRFGSLFNSLVFTFKLKNAYLSNLVKCGMNNKKGDFKELEEYDSECVKTCVENILTKEIDAINPVVVFCFGNKVQHNLLRFYEGNHSFLTVTLPQPSGRNSLYDSDFYRHLYFGLVLEGLVAAGVLSIDQGAAHYREFLIHAP